ncbi:glutamate--cysteine ligase [Shewanella submarina]|uniref:Glutamate--cysteine ligase n=1 Tax=Shewanella submarina TaxID=2016376 RepID=A0ABV7GGW7_9GAMM|nr:glutamate--cysteine ligase [Shewanella submarina]MCL1036267.1 glutamate--cysteine ligase [Shewanella submarina]
MNPIREKVNLKSFNALIDYLATDAGRRALAGIHRGIEREALRVLPEGELAQDPHPEVLGSALTHSRITTDYSEALLEFITPVSKSINELLDGLTQTHAFSVRNLNGQQLWPVSMPCFVGDEADIRIAQYGDSNIGKMKTLYRKGLTYRYGALMQIISGVHFNFSVSDELWTLLYENSDKSLSREDFISERYFGLIRNYRRSVWLLPYLFGASPALCSSFVKGRESDIPFNKTDDGTLYLPYATSLRMSDLGYTNHEQDKLNISYNSLGEYLTGMRAAIRMRSEKFARIGVKVDGEYRQLNDNILQIENEFYAPIRAKRVAASGEKPSEALERGGVEYIEVRALDVNPFSPVGIEESQIRILDLFLLYCLLASSEPFDKVEEQQVSLNLNAVVLEGRNPELMLSNKGETISLRDWAGDIFDAMERLATLLDIQGDEYQQAVAQWRQAVQNPDKTLSGRVMQALSEPGMNNGSWVKGLAREYTQYFTNYPLTPEQLEDYTQAAAESIARQRDIEALDKVGFDEFLADYFGDIRD